LAAAISASGGFAQPTIRSRVTATMEMRITFFIAMFL
jgi:hypothetical protein